MFELTLSERLWVVAATVIIGVILRFTVWESMSICAFAIGALGTQLLDRALWRIRKGYWT